MKVMFICLFFWPSYLILIPPLPVIAEKLTELHLCLEYVDVIRVETLLIVCRQFFDRIRSVSAIL